MKLLKFQGGQICHILPPSNFVTWCYIALRIRCVAQPARHSIPRHSAPRHSLSLHTASHSRVTHSRHSHASVSEPHCFEAPLLVHHTGHSRPLKAWVSLSVLSVVYSSEWSWVSLSVASLSVVECLSGTDQNAPGLHVLWYVKCMLRLRDVFSMKLEAWMGGFFSFYSGSTTGEHSTDRSPAASGWSSASADPRHVQDSLRRSLFLKKKVC